MGFFDFFRKPQKITFSKSVIDGFLIIYESWQQDGRAGFPSTWLGENYYDDFDEIFNAKIPMDKGFSLFADSTDILVQIDAKRKVLTYIDIPNNRILFSVHLEKTIEKSFNIECVVVKLIASI